MMSASLPCNTPDSFDPHRFYKQEGVILDSQCFDNLEKLVFLVGMTFLDNEFPRGSLRKSANLVVILSAQKEHRSKSFERTIFQRFPCSSEFILIEGFKSRERLI
ncbi:hypothetical protein Tco_1156769 [Tanacetum coccineum]